ncbi:MALD2 protein, partial [Amia calva]|nr:MALD2 protein [Amia calva]
MSFGEGSATRFDRVRGPHYDQVPQGSFARQDVPRLMEELRDSELAASSEILPPPPLPEQPPVGPEFSLSNSEEHVDQLDIKPVRRFIPDSWKNFFRSSDRSSKDKSWPMSNSESVLPSQGVRCSPPASPSIPGSYRDPYGGSGGSYNSRKEREAMLTHDPFESIDGRTQHTAMTYSEKVEAYNLRYAYMKSWAGLLRILGCVELLLGAAVFACVCAYVHKDNEWYNMFGYSQPQMYGMGSSYSNMGSGAYYNGPQTPFILVVAGLAWIVTCILLVLGMTMYYRTILLDSNWWPLTEFVMNIALFILYLAASIAYVRDTTRGGLCSYPIFNNGINGAFCRVEAGQTAAMIFLFVTTLVYLVSAIVCLKLWRHEAARRYKESLGLETTYVGFNQVMALLLVSGPLIPRDQGTNCNSVGLCESEVTKSISLAISHNLCAIFSSKAPEQSSVPVPMPQPEVYNGHIPSGHIPKPLVMPDYVAKYPVIRTDDERDRYKAVFNDQYAEYKELHAEVHSVVKKFDEMDAMMSNLPLQPGNQMERDRINHVLQEYKRKKNDPTFLEKKERCEYLKNKLSHIKQKIQEYDKVMEWNDGYT